MPFLFSGDFMTYSEKLKDPRWQKKRLEILERDKWKCQCCEDEETTLHVHHFNYERGKEPWEYNNDSLITLCENCHEFESYQRKSSEESLLIFFRENKFFSQDLDHIASFIIDHPDFMNKVNDYCASIELKAMEEWKAKQGEYGRE
jgi:hypothetical protein